MANIYISYIVEATTIAQNLARALQQIEHNVWTAIPNPNDNRCKFISTCDLVIMLISPNAAAAQQMFDDFKCITKRHLIGQKKVKLLCVQIDNSVIPGYLDNCWVIEFDKADACEVLLQVEHVLRRGNTKRAIAISSVMAFLATILSLSLAFLALVPDEYRTYWFCWIDETCPTIQPTQPDDKETPTATHSLTPTFAPLPLIISDFNSCEETLAGSSLINVDFVQDSDIHGCVAQLNYVGSSLFWIKLNDVDITYYNKLMFDLRADSSFDGWQTKIELKRANETIDFDLIHNISEEWQTITIDFVNFSSLLSAYTDMQEIVFVFEQELSSETGAIYLDNIQFAH